MVAAVTSLSFVTGHYNPLLNPLLSTTQKYVCTSAQFYFAVTWKACHLQDILRSDTDTHIVLRGHSFLEGVDVSPRCSFILHHWTGLTDKHGFLPLQFKLLSANSEQRNLMEANLTLLKDERKGKEPSLLKMLQQWHFFNLGETSPYREIEICKMRLIPLTFVKSTFPCVSA